MAIFVSLGASYHPPHLPGIFSPFWCVWVENTRVPSSLFLLPQLNTLQKVFPSHFLLFFFILPKIHSTKHNLSKNDIILIKLD